MSNLVDTLMNLVVFAFIGLLLWIYFHEFDVDRRDESDE